MLKFELKLCQCYMESKLWLIVDQPKEKQEENAKQTVARKWFAHCGTTKKKVKVNLKPGLVEHRW